jgi:hypothetical protein
LSLYPGVLTNNTCEPILSIFTFLSKLEVNSLFELYTFDSEFLVSIVTFCLFDKNIDVQLAKRNTVQIEKRNKNLVFMFLVLIKSEKKLSRKSC